MHSALLVLELAQGKYCKQIQINGLGLDKESNSSARRMACVVQFQSYGPLLSRAPRTSGLPLTDHAFEKARPSKR